MIRVNIDAIRQIEGERKKQTESSASSAAQMSGVNSDCYVHYYIQQQNASIA